MKRIITLLAMAFIAALAQAQPMFPTPDAKSLGMGGVTMTTVGGSHALYGNAALAAFSPSPVEVSASYLGQKQLDYYAVTAACRFGRDNVGQIGWRQQLPEAGDNNMALDLGYSRRIGERWAVGIVGRYLRTKNPETAVNALSVDLSAAYTLPLNFGSYSALRAGARLGNLGGYLEQSAYSLPMDITAGVALDTFLSDAHEVTVGTDIGYCFTPDQAQGVQLSVGAEYNLMQLIQLRAGYHYGENRIYNPNYASVGAGVRFLHLRLDFAYLFAQKKQLMHNTYSLSFGFDF